MGLNACRLTTIEEVRAVMEVTCERVGSMLRRYGYRELGRRARKWSAASLVKFTSLWMAQVERLIGQYRQTGRVRDRRTALSE